MELDTRPDALGVHVGHALIEGTRAARVRFSPCQGHLVICELEALPGAPAGVEGRCIEFLIARYRPPRITHGPIVSSSIVEWYRRSPMAAAVVLSGRLGAHSLDCDSLIELPIDAMRAQPIMVTAMYFASLAVEEGPLDREAVLGGVVEEDVQRRIVTLRRVARHPELDPELILEVHRAAMFDLSASVRQLAAQQLGDAYEVPHLVFPIARHLETLHAPTMPRRDPVGAFDPERGRASARLCALWILGLLRHRAERHRDLVECGQLRTRLAAETLSESEDRTLFQRTAAELEGGSWVLGVERRVSLLEALRYVVHRHRIIARLGESPHDRLYWLADALDRIYPSPRSPIRMTGEDPRPVAQLIFGPSPRLPLPAGFAQAAEGGNPYHGHWPDTCE